VRLSWHFSSKHRRFSQAQGVGFRPAVYRSAKSLNLAGFVFNDKKSVTIELQSREKEIDEFLIRLCSSDKPPSLTKYALCLKYDPGILVRINAACKQVQ
jgi:acylphosphatase